MGVMMQMFEKFLKQQMGGGGMGKMGGGMKNKSGGNMKGNSGNKAPMGHDPAGSGRVYVRGFDFGTKEAQLRKHRPLAVRLSPSVVIASMRTNNGHARISITNNTKCKSLTRNPS